ncbi:MAG: DUF4956 domain-containing protein [Clostridia bacterium]|nr:DUF4956 domain-containing protein [Clostridia bacterium]
MLETIFQTATGAITLTEALICIAVSLVLGIAVSLCYLFKNGSSTKSMAVSLVLLPTLVQTVIMMVNGNLGAGVAVLGAFSLIRFRSVPGSARDICCIFTSMAIGLGCGMGYVVFSAIFAVIVCVAQLLLTVLPYGDKKIEDKELRIVIPETLDYMDAFDSIFSEYTRECKLMQVKTTNLGSMFDLRYKIQLRDPSKEKKFIDEIRCRNGNLTVSVGHYRREGDEL